MTRLLNLNGEKVVNVIKAFRLGQSYRVLIGCIVKFNRFHLLSLSYHDDVELTKFEANLCSRLPCSLSILGTSVRKSLRRYEQDHLREVLKKVREEAGLSQRALSTKLGLPLTYIARIERGERTIDVVEFIDVAEALGINPMDFFARVLEYKTSNQKKTATGSTPSPGE